jgi:Helicase conserved C-terminal domain
MFCDARTSYIDRDGGQKDWNSFSIIRDEKDIRDSIMTALETEPAQQLMTLGIDHWLRYRQAHSRSQALVVAHTQKKAKEYLEFVRNHYPNVKAAVAVSDDGSDASKAIKGYRLGKTDLLITVGMAYEGLDLPRMTHVVVLTQFRTTEYIEQTLGRITRVDEKAGAWHTQRGFAFLPQDPLMLAIRDRIEAEQATALQNVGQHPGLGLGGGGGSPSNGILPIDGALTGSYASELGGIELTAEDTALYERLAAEHGVIGSPAQLHRMFADRSDVPEEVFRSDDGRRVGPAEREKRLRDGIEVRCRQTDRFLGHPFGWTNGQVLRRFKTPRADMKSIN